MKLYILLLSITLGASLFAGVVVAPIIFGANEYLTTIAISRFEAGILMTQIFLKLSYLVNFTAFIIFIYEAKAYFEFKANKIATMLSLVTIFTGLLFSLYYVPLILEAQKLGEIATNSEVFAKNHQMSVIDFKIFIVALLSLIVFNLYKRDKK